MICKGVNVLKCTLIPLRKTATLKARSCDWSTDVCAAKLGVDALKVVSTRPDVLNETLWGILYAVVVLFTELKEKGNQST